MRSDLSELRDAHARFLELVGELRPELHRFCARMTGSVVDGEDVVQDTIIHAYFALSSRTEMPEAMRPWLFRIAHNRAIDVLRRYDRRNGTPYEHDIPSDRASADDVLDVQLAARAALATFFALPPTQRACVILKDVLGHSSQEIGTILSLSVPAVDACLHRGRRALRARAETAPPEIRGHGRPVSPIIERYARLFQERDWNAVRALLADDVQLDLVGHSRRAGSEVGKYYANYATLPPYRIATGVLEDRQGLYVFASPDDVTPAYFIELATVGDAIAMIRDFRFVPYMLDP